MFHKRKPRTSLDFTPPTGKLLLKRAVTLLAGIFFLWIALQVMPKPVGRTSHSLSPSTETPITSPEGSEQQAKTSSVLKNTQIIAGILLIGLIGYMYYRHKKTSKDLASIKPLKTLSRVQLAPNQHIYLVECGNDVLLIGATPSQLTLLKDIPYTTLTHSHSEETAPAVSYTFTTSSSNQEESDDFASILHTYSSASTN